MQVTNTAARLVFVPAPNGLLRFVPLQLTDVTAADEPYVQAALDGPLKALVDNGELVVVPTAPPPEGGATGTGTGTGTPTGTGTEDCPPTPPMHGRKR